MHASPHRKVTDLDAAELPTTTRRGVLRRWPKTGPMLDQLLWALAVVVATMKRKPMRLTTPRRSAAMRMVGIFAKNPAATVLNAIGLSQHRRLASSS